MRLILLVKALSLVMALPMSGLAQLAPPDRVRVLTGHGFTFKGVVMQATPDSVQLNDRGSFQWVRRADIAFLERSAGYERKFLRNFGTTMATAAGAVGLMQAISWKKCVSNELFGCLFATESRSDAFFEGAVVGAVLSVPVGVVLGLALQYERWEPASVPAPGGGTLSIAPTLHRGIGLSGTISF